MIAGRMCWRSGCSRTTKTQTVGVLNAGIGGNRMLLDGLGPNALARFDRDVLAPAGVRYLIVLEGVNDLGTLTRDGEVGQAEHDALVHRILSAYEQMADACSCAWDQGDWGDDSAVWRVGVLPPGTCE